MTFAYVPTHGLDFELDLFIYLMDLSESLDFNTFYLTLF